MLTLHWGGLKGEDFFREVLINRPPAVPTPSGGLFICYNTYMDIENERAVFTQKEQAAVPWRMQQGGFPLNSVRKHLAEWEEMAEASADASAILALESVRRQMEVHDLEELFAR